MIISGGAGALWEKDKREVHFYRSTLFIFLEARERKLDRVPTPVNSFHLSLYVCVFVFCLGCSMIIRQPWVGWLFLRHSPLPAPPPTLLYLLQDSQNTCDDPEVHVYVLEANNPRLFHQTRKKCVLSLCPIHFILFFPSLPWRMCFVHPFLHLCSTWLLHRLPIGVNLDKACVD